jgi:hypothetical protein
VGANSFDVASFPGETLQLSLLKLSSFLLSMANVKRWSSARPSRFSPRKLAITSTIYDDGRSIFRCTSGVGTSTIQQPTNAFIPAY